MNVFNDSIATSKVYNLFCFEKIIYDKTFFSKKKEIKNLEEYPLWLNKLLFPSLSSDLKIIAMQTEDQLFVNSEKLKMNIFHIDWVYII